MMSDMSFAPASLSVPAGPGANRPQTNFIAFKHGTITGRVRLGEGGAPVAGVEVSATAVGETEPADSYTTRATGTFRLSVPFGSYTIKAEAGGYTFPLPNNTISVAPGTPAPFGDIIAMESGNFPPAFTSDAEFDVEEGETEIGEVVAEDPDDDYIKTYEILSGAGMGADGGLMAIDEETGDLKFKAARDFDEPGDDDEDNVYEVTVQVTSGGSGTARDLMATQDIDVTVTSTDEWEVTMVLTPDEISEGGGTSVVSATVDPASPTAFAVTVTVTDTNDETDEADDETDDYAELSRNVTLFFAADAEESTGSVSITAINNNAYEGDKTFEVIGTVVPDLDNFSVEDAELTIEDDDVAPPQVTLSLRPSRIDEGGEVELRVSLTKLYVDNQGDEADLTVGLGANIVQTVADATERGDPGTVDFNGTTSVTVTIPAGRTTPAADAEAITLTAPNNALANGDWTYNVGGTTTGFVGVTPPDSVPLRVSDDDAAPSAPRNIEVTATTVGSLTVEWDRPTSAGLEDGETGTITEYQYRHVAKVGGKFSFVDTNGDDIGNWSSAGNGDVRVLTVPSLTEDTEYRVQISGSQCGSTWGRRPSWGCRRVRRWNDRYHRQLTLPSTWAKSQQQ